MPGPTGTLRPVPVPVPVIHTVPYASDKRTREPAHVPLKPTLVEGVDSDVVSGIVTDTRTDADGDVCDTNASMVRCVWAS